MALNVYRGDAPAAAQVTKIAPLSPQPGQTFSVFCNGKPATYLMQPTDAVSDVVNGLVAALAQASGNTSTPEFTEFSAAADASGLFLTLTAATAGVPFIVTVSGSGNMIVVRTTSGAPGQNEFQEIELVGTYTGGTFTVTIPVPGNGNQTTGNIAYNASGATMQTSLAALTGVGSGNVQVNGSNPWFVTWIGALGNQAIGVGTVNGTNLTGGANCQLTELAHGAPPSNCIQVVDFSAEYDLADPVPTYTLTLDGQTTAAIGQGDTAAQVQTKLQALSTIGSGNCLVYCDPTNNFGIGKLILFTGALAGVAVDQLQLTNWTGNSAGDVAPVTSVLQAGGATSADDFQLLHFPQLILNPPTFQLKYKGQTTTPLSRVDLPGPPNYAAARIQAALCALSTVGAGNCIVTTPFEPDVRDVNAGAQVIQGYFLVRFTGALANLASSPLTIIGGGTGGNTPTVTGISHGPAAINEEYSLWTAATGGTFTLTSGAQTTNNIAYNASAATVQTRIQTDLSTNITACTVTGAGTQSNPWLITITAPADTAVTITANGANLTGGAGTIIEITAGHAGINEVQSITEALGVTGGTFSVSIGGAASGPVPWNCAPINVQTQLTALPTVNTVTVAGQLTFSVNATGGNFTITLGAQTTNNIAYNASTATIQTRLQTDLSTAITACTVTGAGSASNPWVATVTNPTNTVLAGATLNAAGLTGGTSSGQIQSGYQVTWSGTQGSTPQPLLFADGTYLTGPTVVYPLTVSRTAFSAGPNHYDTAANWTNLRVPDTLDQAVFDPGASSCLYGLNQIATVVVAATPANTIQWANRAGGWLGNGYQDGSFVNDQVVYFTNAGGALPTGISAGTAYHLINVNRDAGTCQLALTAGGAPVTISSNGTGTQTMGVRLMSLEVTARYTGQIGLSRFNGLGYLEYRKRHLHVGFATTGQTGLETITLGDDSGNGSGKIQIDHDVDQVAITVYSSGGSIDTDAHAVMIKGNNASATFEQVNGDVGLSVFEGETFLCASIKERAGTLELGPGVNLQGPISRTGGTLICDACTINGAVDI